MKRTERLILIFLLTFGFCFSQEDNAIKSMKEKIKSHKSVDSVKIELMLDLAWEYSFYDYRSAISVCDEAMKLSNNITYDNGIATALSIKGNSYRALNIAFIDEWRNFCEKHNLDLNKILNYIRLRETHKNIMRPGLSPGGYCLTKDPLFGIISSKYIFKKNKSNFPLSKISIEINKKITNRVIQNIENQFPNINKARKKICIFGIAYKNNVGDTRHTSAEKVYDYFIKNRSQVYLFDPYLDYWKEKNRFLDKKIDLREIDVAFFIAPHKIFNKMKFVFKKNCIIVDANNVFSIKKKEYIKKKYLNYFFIGYQKKK